MTIPRIDRLDKNFLINGGFDYAQRALGPVTINSTPSYETVDRWEVSAAGTFTVLQSLRSANAPSSKTKFSHEFNFRRNATTGQFFMSQKIESIFAKELIGKPISMILSQFFSEAPTNVEIRISSADVEDDFSTVTSIGTFAFSEIDTTISQWNKEILENITTLPSDASRGIQIEIVADFASATDGADKTYRIGEIKLGIGKASQDFSYAGRDIVEELQLSQRYYRKSYALDTSISTSTELNMIRHGWRADQSPSGKTIHYGIMFDILMRAAPICNTYGYLGASLTISIYHGSGARKVSDNAVTLSNQSSNGFTVNEALGAGADHSGVGIHYTADIEL